MSSNCKSRQNRLKKSNVKDKFVNNLLVSDQMNWSSNKALHLQFNQKIDQKTLMSHIIIGVQKCI